MTVNVLARAVQGIAPWPIEPLPEALTQRGAGPTWLGAAIDETEQLHQIALDLEAPIAVSIAESQPRIAQQPQQGLPISDAHAAERRDAFRGYALAGPVQHEFYRWLTEADDEPTQQARLERDSWRLARTRGFAGVCKPLRSRGGVHSLFS
jgi:hypothetical protein